MLKDKVALITGASQGIGKEVALTLAGYGAKIAVNYYPGCEADAAVVVKEVEAMGVEAFAVEGDVTNFDGVKEMFDSVLAQFGRIDILVNNAGITKDNLALKMSERDFDAVIAVNLKGTFNCMKHISKIMLKQKYGRIINMSSIVGVHGNAGQVNYAATKAGVIGMAKSLAQELGSRNITVNAVAPGFIDTDMTKGLPEDVKKQMLAGIPLRRMGQVKDIAEAVAFLASDRASYITGQTLLVDGGMGM